MTGKNHLEKYTFLYADKKTKALSLKFTALQEPNLY